MSWLEVSDVNGVVVLMNMRQVRYFRSQGKDRCCFTFDDGGTFVVRHSYDEIKSRLKRSLTSLEYSVHV